MDSGGNMAALKTVIPKPNDNTLVFAVYFASKRLSRLRYISYRNGVENALKSIL